MLLYWLIGMLGYAIGFLTCSVLSSSSRAEEKNNTYLLGYKDGYEDGWEDKKGSLLGYQKGYADGWEDKKSEGGREK